MRDDARTDIQKRLACARGHLEATLHMVERGDHDLAVAHQLCAVRGALIQIQVRLLRAQIERWTDPSIDLHAIEYDLSEIVITRK